MLDQEPVADAPLRDLTLAHFHEVYRAHLGSLQERSPAVLGSGHRARAEHGGVALEVEVDDEGRVVAALAEGCRTEVSRVVLAYFAETLVGLPVDECRDHAVHRFEFALRKDHKVRPVPGIVTPRSAGMAFRDLAVLTRLTFQAYESTFGVAARPSEYQPVPGPRWAEATDVERMQWAEAAWESFASAWQLSADLGEVLEIERTTRVHFAAHPSLMAEAPDVLLDLEVYVRAHIDPALVIRCEEKLDKNKIRATRGLVDASKLKR